MIDKINIYENIEDLCKGFTSFLQTELSKKENITLSLSGGSTPKVLFNFWADNCQNSIEWEKIKFFWGDERCVPPNDAMSNYGMTNSTLFSKVDTILPINIHRILGENSPKDEAIRYSDVLNKYLDRENTNPSFDILILGLGHDGHTASIFPESIELWDAENNCVVASHPETGMERISITGKIINNAGNVAFLVTGKNKAEKVHQIIKQREQFINLYPAARVSPLSSNLYWFLDKEAAQLL